VRGVWASSVVESGGASGPVAVLDARARRACALPADDFVLDLALCHALDGQRAPFESAAAFADLLRECARGLALARFAATLESDDFARAVGRLAAEEAAQRARDTAAMAAARAAAAEAVRLEKLKVSSPSKYQELMAEQILADKAAAVVAERLASELEAALAEAAATAAAEEAVQRRAAEKAAYDAARAKVTALNALADSDPAAYALAIQEEARIQAEADANAAGDAVGASGSGSGGGDRGRGGRSGAKRQGAAGKRDEAMEKALEVIDSHRADHTHLQDQRRRLRQRVAPFFGGDERPIPR
jgi:cell pole-organizing protein PopZ